MAGSVNGYVWGAFEESITPPSSEVNSNLMYAGQLAQKSVVAIATFPIGIVTGAIYSAQKIITYCLSFVFWRRLIPSIISA